MKRFFFPLMVLLTACGTCAPLPEESSVPAGPKPEPISRVELSDGEKARVESGNVFAFQLLEQVFGSTKKSVFISPLSVQYALGMVNNGASGATEKEISTVLGQEGRDGINEVCAHLLRDLPRVDTSVGGRGQIGEFGWDGAAGAWAMIDPINHVSAFFGMHVRNFAYCYDVIHPTLRDLIYGGLGWK